MNETRQLQPECFMIDIHRRRLDEIFEVGTGVVYANTFFICVDRNSPLLDDKIDSEAYILVGLDGKLVTLMGNDLVRRTIDFSMRVEY